MSRWRKAVLRTGPAWAGGERDVVGRVDYSQLRFIGSVEYVWFEVTATRDPHLARGHACFMADSLISLRDG